MSFALETNFLTESVSHEGQLPLDVAKAYRGRRVELRQEYENTNDPERKEFLKKTLQNHTELMIQDNKPIKSFLWKAEKDGHHVFLFGDLHKTIQKTHEVVNLLLSCEGKLAPFYKSYIHPQVLEAFENSEQLYLESFIYKHADWWNELNTRLLSQYPTFLSKTQEDSDGLYSKAMSEQGASLAGGLSDYMYQLKGAKDDLNANTSLLEIISNLGDSLKEMHDLETHAKTTEMMVKLTVEDKVLNGVEVGFETIDAVQMGNLNSLELLYKETPFEMIADCEERNILYAACILSALEKGESAFFAPGASHYIGQKGILNLLEKEGVTMTQIDLT